MNKLVYEGVIDTLFAARTFAWWLSDVKTDYPVTVFYTSATHKTSCYFTCETDKLLWVAGFESLIESRLDPI